jgi:transposase
MDNNKTQIAGRVIGLDCHPDTFTAAPVRGSTPASAQVEKTFDQVPMGRLESWVRKNTTEADVLVLEASGNSFQIARFLRKLNRQAKVLESGFVGKLKEAHANNDKISAVRIAKAYLAGTAKEVWVPDPKTQQRRDWHHAHQKAVKRTTQMRNRLLSYLSDNAVRLPKGTRLAGGGQQTVKQIRQAAEWSERQWQVIEILLAELQHAEQQRTKWRSLIAQEVASDPVLLSLMRLCGVRVIIAFALGAVIGDIHRFANPKALVKYVGLNPAFDHSGQNQWQGGIGGHGRKDIRSLLIEAAQSILRSKHPLAKWGKKLLARKGLINLTVAAIARKLTVAIWYLMMGKWTPVAEIDSQLKVKISKLISTIGPAVLKARRLTRKRLREDLAVLLQNHNTHVLQPA